MSNFKIVIILCIQQVFPTMNNLLCVNEKMNKTNATRTTGLVFICYNSHWGKLNEKWFMHSDTLTENLHLQTIHNAIVKKKQIRERE